MDYIKSYFERFYEGLEKIDCAKLDEVINILYGAWKENQQVFLIGNGGSAATASHMACDLSKGTIDSNSLGKRLKVVSLADNVATLSAIGNDIGYDSIFSQQLVNLAKPKDILIAITASGNSPNILKAVRYAKSIGMKTIGLLGFDGGKAKNELDLSVLFEEKHYGRVEDFHLMAEHIITERLREMIKED